MKQNINGTSYGVLQIIKKIGIILGAVVIVFLSLNFIPAKKATESNVILEKENILIMAEKGGYALNPANTRKAFDRVIKSNSDSDIVELDVRTSKDGILMIWEDATINAAALKEDAEEVYVSDTTAEELKKFNLGNNFVNDKGSKPYQNITSYVSQGLSMMTFEEFIYRYNSSRTSVYYMVDIQETGQRGCEAVDLAVKALSDEDYESFKKRVIFSTADLEVKNYINEKYSEFMVCGKGEYVKKLVNVSKLGYQFLHNADYELVQVGMETKGLFGINFNLVKKSFLRKTEARNIATIYTNITTEEEVKALYELGAHVIATPDPIAIDDIINALDKEADK